MHEIFRTTTSARHNEGEIWELFEKKGHKEGREPAAKSCFLPVPQTDEKRKQCLSGTLCQKLDARIVLPQTHNASSPLLCAYFPRMLFFADCLRAVFDLFASCVRFLFLHRGECLVLRTEPCWNPLCRRTHMCETKASAGTQASCVA